MKVIIMTDKEDENPILPNENSNEEDEPKKPSRSDPVPITNEDDPSGKPDQENPDVSNQANNDSDEEPPPSSLKMALQKVTTKWMNVKRVIQIAIVSTSTVT